MKPLKVRITLLCLTGFSVIALCVATLPSAAGGWSLINTSAAQTQSWEDKVDPKVLSCGFNRTGRVSYLPEFAGRPQRRPVAFHQRRKRAVCL